MGEMLENAVWMLERRGDYVRKHMEIDLVCRAVRLGVVSNIDCEKRGVNGFHGKMTYGTEKGRA